MGQVIAVAASPGSRPDVERGNLPVPQRAPATILILRARAQIPSLLTSTATCSQYDEVTRRCLETGKCEKTNPHPKGGAKDPRPLQPRQGWNSISKVTRGIASRPRIGYRLQRLRRTGRDVPRR